MSCCDDPTAHQPSSSETAASASALKALTSSGVTVECPDPIVAAAMLEATQLTDKEREIILGVLGRDELLRRDQQLRVLQLKAELQNLRRKGALKPTTNLDTTGPDQDPDRYCRRCRVELGRVINRGSYCRACRLKVCKACREYSLRTTDWVCTVCKKQMEIQAASGEWMNEFVKRPSKRRENRVCLPTADIIKRTIRRSWTISNPTPRWSAMRGSPEHRPYNSLPRKQDINNYPSLALYQANLKNQENFSQENPSPTYRRRSPRRTQSEDIYDDQGPSSQFRGTSPATQGGISPEMDVFNQRSSRMNPFIKLPDGRPDIERRRSPMRRSNEGSSEDGSSKEDGSPKSKGILTPETARKFDRNNMEKRVSFESHVPYTRMSRPTTVLRTQSLIEGRIQNHLPSRYPAHQEDNSDNSEEAAHGDAHDSREENNPIELCEIEPFSGTVFRKMMVRRRRQNNARNISGSTSNCSTTAENGWRRGPDSDLWDILLPEGDDYKLVFINSDGSSKEETSSREEDDNDSSSTASSFPIDECDWDYFEPGTRPAPVINWSSPFGSPRVYRRGVADSPIGSPLVYRRRMRESDTGTDEDNVRQDSGSPASSDSIFQPRIISEDPPFDSTTQLRSEKMLEDTDALRCVHSEDVSTKPCCHACGAPTQFIPIPVPVPIPFPVPTLWPPHEPPLMVFGEQRFRVLPRNLWPYLSQAALIWPALNTNGGTIGTTMPATTDRDTSALETHKEPDIEPPVVETEEEITGYLECENRYASSSDSSSDDSDNSGPRVRRMYNVSGTERHSDDALPSSNVSSDNDENDGRLSHSSVREDDMTSSGSDDTDSDDTGTVADQKSKRFSRIFVVNKNLSSSSNSCSSSSDTDTSDNDTDTELDCTVILTNVKQLEEEKDDVCDSKSSDKDTKKTENEYYFSSPGLSDVSAESVNSSDVDNNDLITKETNVISTLSKANVEKNLCKNKFNDDSRKKKVCFDDTDAVDKVTFTDEVAVIKLNKRDIEAINRENDLPFGNEFKLSQAEHFKINKDEVDDAVNENKENSSCLVKSNLTKANKKSKKTAVTFSLSEGNNNKSEEDNKTHDNIEATSDKNDEEFIVSVISGEETNSNESLTKEHLDFIAISGTTEIAVNDDNKGKTNNYSKTVLSACSTIQANILFDEQNNENLDLIISPSLTDTFGNDDVNIQNPKDFITFSTSDQVLDDNYEKIDKSTETTINDDDDYKTSFFSDSTTENLTTTDDLIVKIVKNNEDFDTDNLETITDTHILTEEQLNDYFQIFSNSTNKTSNDSDIIDNKNDDETTISALRLTARRINDNEDIETKNYDKFTKSAGSKRNDHLAEDTGDNDKDNDVEMEDIFNLDSLISNLTIENDKDVDTKSFDKLNVFSGTTTDEGAVSDDMDTTDNEGNGFINKFEIVQVTITPDSLSILDFDLIKSTINAEDVKDNIEGVVVSNDYLEESGKYGVVEELSSDIDDTTSKLNKDLNKTCDENDEKQDTIKIRETLIDGTVTSNKLDDTDTAGLEKYQDVMNLDNLVVPSSVEERRKVEYVEKSESIITTDMLLSSNELNEEINKVISKSMDNYEKVDEELKINDGTVDLNLLTTSMDKQDAKFDISSRKLADDEELDDGNEINEENDTLFDKTYTIITDNEKIETIEVDQSSLTIDKNETMLEKELTNIDETIIEDIDKLHETIAACNLIDTVMNFDSDSNEYNDDMDLPKYDTIFNAKTVKELPISQKINNTTLHSLETAEILDDSQEKAINDNVDDYIVTEYDILSFTENAENINVTDNEYYTFSSPLGASKATELFNKLPEKTSTERVDDIKATEYGTDRFSSTFGISRKAQKLDTDDDKICEYKTLSVGAPKAAQRLSKSKEKRSSERADNSGAIKYGNAMLFSAYDATKNAEKIVKPEEKISTSNIDDDIITDYEFEMLSHGTSKHAQKLSKPENNISTSEANDEFETLAHGTSTQAEKLTKSIKKIGTIEADDEFEIFTHGTSKHAQILTEIEEKIITSKADDINVTDYEFVSLSSVNPAIKNVQKFTEPQEEISNDNAGKDIVTEYECNTVSLAPKTTLEKSEEKTSIKSTDDNNAIEYALSSSPNRSQSTENVDDENATKYEFAIQSSAQGDLKNVQELTKLQEILSTDYALFLEAPKTTPRLSESQEKTNIESIDDNSAIEYDAYGASKRHQTLTKAHEEISTENADDTNGTKYEFSIHSSDKEDLQKAPRLTKLQEVISTDDSLFLGAPTTPRLSKSQQKINIGSTDDNRAIEYEYDAYGASKKPQTLTKAHEEISTENTDDNNVTKYEFAILSPDQEDLQKALKLTKHQEVISTDDALFLGAPITPRLSKSREKTNIESANDNSSIEYEYDAYGALKRPQTLTKAHDEISTENADDTNGTKDEFAIHSSDQEDLQKAPRLTKLQEVISTDDGLSLDAPKTTPSLSKSQEKTNIESTDDISPIEYEYDAYGALKRPQTLTKAHEEISTENADDTNGTKYEFAIHSSDQEGLQKAPRLTKLQEVISTDDGLSLDAPKTTPSLSKSQEKTNIESTDDISAIEYEYDAYGALKRPKTLTKVHEEISTENADDTNGTKDEFAIHSSDQEDLQKAPKLTKLQEVISTDDSLSLDAPKTTPSLSKSQEKTNIESTDDISAIEYEYDAYGSLKRPQILTKAHEEISTENADNTNGTKYEFAIHSSDQEGLQKAPRLTKLQEVISTDDGLSLDAPKTTPSLSKSQEKTNIESTDDISTIEYEYDVYGASKRPQTLTIAHGKISIENETEENVTKYELATLSLDRDDLNNAKKLTKLQEVIKTDDNVTGNEFNAFSPGAPKTTPRINKTLEKTSDKKSNVIDYEYDPLSSAYGISKTAQKLTKSQENINSDETIEFATLSLAESASKTVKRLDKSQDKPNTETVDYKNVTDDDTCSSKATQVLGKLREEIITEDTDDKNITESDNDKQKIGFEKAADNIVEFEYTLGIPKFVLKPFDTEEINIFEENDKYGNNKNAADDNVLKSDYTLFSPLDIPKETQEISTNPQDPISSEIKNSTFDKSAGEINDEFAYNEFNKTPKKFELYMLDEPRDSFERFTRAASPGVKFEIKPFDTEEINIFEENDESGQNKNAGDDFVLDYDYTISSAQGIPRETQGKFAKSQELISSERKISKTSKSADEMNKEIADDQKTKYILHSAALDFQKYHVENICKESDKFNETPKKFEHHMLDEPRDSFEKFTRVLSPGVKFELKPFDTEEINIFEENDESGQNKNSADDFVLDYDYTISSAQGIPRETQRKFAKSQELISSERKISKTSKSADEMNKEIADDEKTKYILHSAALDFQKYHVENICKESDKFNETPKKFELYMLDEPRDSFEKFTRDISLGVKFELKPFDTEEINIFEENDESGQNKNAADDFVLDYDYTISSAQGIPRETQGKFAKSQELISSERKISKTSKSADEMNKEIADDEKTKYIIHSPALHFQKHQGENICKESGKCNVTPRKFELYMLDEPRDSFERFTRAASPGVKFEIKPFDTEEINIFEENDESGQNKNAGDDFVLDYDYTISSAQGPRETQGKFAKSQELISSKRKISKTSKSADEMNKEIADDEKTKYIIHSPALDFQKHHVENICKESEKCNVTPRKFELYMLDEPRDSLEKFTRAASPGVKFELKPFDTEEINIFEENDKSGKTKNAAERQETISFKSKFSTSGKAAHEINKDFADDEKFTRAASSGVKFELKPFDTEEINIFEEKDKSATNDYAIEYDYILSSALVIPKKTQGKFAKPQEAISSERKISTTSGKSSDETIKELAGDEKTNSQAESPGVKFELKPFDIETISIFEETDKSEITVALKDLDIVKNKQDLNYSEYSNRTVIYSSFDNNEVDVSRRHEIIQSFDKSGRITDCTVDIKSDNDDDEDTFQNFDKINLAQTFKFTLRSYGEEEKNIIRDSKKPNVLEKIFKKKVKSEKDSPPQQQEIDRLINKMVEAISSEYPTDSDTDNDQLMDVVLGGETPVESAGADDQRALSEWNEIRSIDAVNVEGKSLHGRNDGVQPGAIVCGEVLSRHAARYTSLVMITQDPAPNYQQVSVVTSDTTTLVPGNDVVVRHTNWQEDDNKQLGKKRDNQNQERGSVTVITGGDTLSAFEEGLADDDSWVENLSHDEEDEDEFATNSGTEDSSSGEEVTLTCSAAIDQEEDLRGYHRAAIDFTLHTIVEESCEESEVEQNVPKKKERPASATDLEKYFFFGLGDGMGPSLQSNREDAFSETSSIYSEGMESLGSEEVQTSNDNSDPAELASSRLEKYFLSGFMGFTAERRDSDGSVGSDSEGRPSPEQRRKRLVRARGTGRSHSSSLDNLDNAISEQTIETQMSSEHSSSSDSENYDDTNSFEKPDGQFDTVKRKKNKKHKNTSSADESKNLEITQEIEEKCSDSDEDGNKTPQPEVPTTISNLTTTKNQQSRDSGFVGSCDDLLREQRDNSTPDFTSIKNELIKTELEDITEEKKAEEKSISVSTPPATSLTRKDSFNNWSSDEETNLMMCKMRQFFKTMVANSQLSASSKPSTPNLSCTIKPLPSPRAKRCKPPQLVYFENELTRLMKTVPGIREDQVKEIVEYLSSEDTWSDSYDSSDYTSSDLEITTSKTVLQQQISDSCKQIINKFDNRVDDEGDEGDGGIIDESHGLNKETAFVYQKLVASFEKMAAGENSDSNISKVAPHSSPPLIAKVMHHIGSRLVALMHEVSSGESHASNSPKTKHYHRRLQHKISSASSTTTEDDCPESAGDILGYEEHVPYNLLPRSRSHDLLVGEARILHQSTSGVSDITEEKEASDCERFSWRGSFESALLATDSRNRLSLLGGEASASASALAIAAKRRSAGDLLFSNKSLSREQLDRVRSCGSIGGANSEDKLWVASAIRPNRRRSSVPDATCGSGGSADGEDEDEDIENRSTLPRSLQGGTPTTNSLPRLPTTVSASSIQKSQSHHFLSQNVKSARYRPPGFNRLTSTPKRAVSAPGLQPSHQRRGRRSQQNNVPNDKFVPEASQPTSSSRGGRLLN